MRTKRTPQNRNSGKPFSFLQPSLHHQGTLAVAWAKARQGRVLCWVVKVGLVLNARGSIFRVQLRAVMS
jgi:hypothetical protein